jgi:hypothetical protein
MIVRGFKLLIRSFMDFIFISECEICGKYLEDSKVIVCKECLSKIERVDRFDIERNLRKNLLGAL